MSSRLKGEILVSTIGRDLHKDPSQALSAVRDMGSGCLWRISRIHSK